MRPLRSCGSCWQNTTLGRYTINSTWKLLARHYPCLGRVTLYTVSNLEMLAKHYPESVNCTLYLEAVGRHYPWKVHCKLYLGAAGKKSPWGTTLYIVPGSCRKNTSLGRYTVNCTWDMLTEHHPWEVHCARYLGFSGRTPPQGDTDIQQRQGVAILKIIQGLNA